MGLILHHHTVYQLRWGATEVSHIPIAIPDFFQLRLFLRLSSSTWVANFFSKLLAQNNRFLCEMVVALAFHQVTAISYQEYRNCGRIDKENRGDLEHQILHFFQLR